MSQTNSALDLHSLEDQARMIQLSTNPKNWSIFPLSIFPRHWYSIQ